MMEDITLSSDGTFNNKEYDALKKLPGNFRVLIMALLGFPQDMRQETGILVFRY